MAHRLPRPLYAVAAFVLVLAGVSAQPSGQPPPSADKPKPPEPAAKGKELSAKEIPDVSSKLPRMHHTRSKTFDLPVQMSELDRQFSVGEFRLFMKRPNSTWKLQQSGDADLRRFSCKVDQDGEYWFSLAIVDKSGRMSPVDIGAEPPSQRVMVDTTPPVIKIELSDGHLICKIEDANPDMSSLKAVSRTDVGDVALDPVADKEGMFRIKSDLAKFPVLVTAKDLAGNIGEKEVDLQQFNKTVANASPVPKIEAKETSDEDIEAAIEKSLSGPIGVRTINTGVFEFSVRGDEKLRANTREFRLYKKSATTKWDLIFTGGPATGAFLCNIERNGKFDYVLARLDKSGRLMVTHNWRLEVEGTEFKTPPIRERVRFVFAIDPKTPIAELLPKPAKLAKLPAWTNEDLAKVPELAFGEPLSKELPRHEAIEEIAFAMTKINHLNNKKRDGFMLAMLEQRAELRGLPFLLGDGCRARADQAKAFQFAATQLSALRSDVFQKNFQKVGTPDLLQSSIMQLMPVLNSEVAMGVPRDQMHRGIVAAGGQILMGENGFMRCGWAKTLATVSHIDATRALANLAIFSPEDEVRAAAIEGLKLRRDKDYTDILMQGFRYPLPAVSKRAADAIVKLERKDLLGNLIEVLESPDPRLPVTREGKTTVRELVRVNHHRNCLLCHAPGNTPDVPEGVLKVAVPLPGEPLPKPSDGGYQSTPPPSPDIVVRLDMTYLRQDFSLMMPVADAHPWPEMQRFDFLVRTREITPAEAKAYVEDKEPGRLSPYHRAALYALRELTGRDTEPTAASWRKLLKLAS